MPLLLSNRPLVAQVTVSRSIKFVAYLSEFEILKYDDTCHCVDSWIELDRGRIDDH
jgi:hypothetical protein